MSAKPPFPDRRKILAASIAAAASGLIPAQAHAATTSEAIRPFHVNFPRAELSELRRRIKTTRWPDRETVADESQGIGIAQAEFEYEIPIADAERMFSTTRARILIFLKNGSPELSIVPNSTNLDSHFGQFQWIASRTISLPRVQPRVSPRRRFAIRH